MDKISFPVVLTLYYHNIYHLSIVVRLKSVNSDKKQPAIRVAGCPKGCLISCLIIFVLLLSVAGGEVGRECSLLCVVGLR